MPMVIEAMGRLMIPGQVQAGLGVWGEGGLGSVLTCSDIIWWLSLHGTRGQGKERGMGKRTFLQDHVPQPCGQVLAIHRT